MENTTDNLIVDLTVEIGKAFSDLEAGLKSFALAHREGSVKDLRAKGWDDLADIIVQQEGRELVRSNMSDIINWCDYKGEY